jgi:acyl-CoA reductase-like NAD-dependent aldehyde dehydrogenase
MKHKFATFEVWTGTPQAPRKPVPGTAARGLHGSQRHRTAAPATPALPTLPEAEHAEWAAAQAVTAALLSRDPAKIAQAKEALAAANEATFQAWARLPAAERRRRRAADNTPYGL